MTAITAPEHEYPVFVDGNKVCTAQSASYTVDRNVTYHGDHRGNRVAEQDPPEYTIHLTVPDDEQVPVTKDSRVECGFPPGVHDADGWLVVELWEIHRIYQSEGTLELSAWQGDVHTGVEYLGEDTPYVDDDGTLVEQERTADRYETVSLDDIELDTGEK